MSKKITPSDLSLEELEALLETRRHAERARHFRTTDPPSRFRPITVLPTVDHARAPGTPSKTARAGWRNRLLFIIEMVALGGLIAIIIGALTNIETLKNDVTEVRGLATLRDGENSATTVSADGGVLVVHPDLNAKVTELPGSSFPPEDENFPPALGLSIKPVKVAPPPPPIFPQSPTRIVIPAIGVDWPIVEGDDWDALKIGVGHRVGTSNPGARGNMILSGHNDVYGEVFKNLEFLGMNQDVVIYAGERKFRYVTRVRRIVPPTDLSPLNPSREPIVTLITCWPYRVDTFRLILIGELVE
jgi:sortase A